jgi:hypothetical protein
MGAEARFFSEQDSPTQWILSREDIEKSECPSHNHRATMMTSFVSGKGLGFIKILPAGQTMNADR